MSPRRNRDLVKERRRGDRNGALRMIRRLAATVTIVLTGLAASAQGASSGPLLNGDFETGDLSNWTTFTTTNGALLADVVSFDANNDGSDTYTARFVAGQAIFEGFDVQRGGGIFQDVFLFDGDLSISADTASQFAFSFCNGDGGTIQVLVDDVVEDSHSFGEMCGPLTKYERLSASLSIDSVGFHRIGFLITRAATLSGVTNFVDNVVLSGTATEDAPGLIADLIALVESYQLMELGNSLNAKLETVQQVLASGKRHQACMILDAFRNQVDAQRGKALTIEQVNQLTTGAQRIKNRLDC